jgi:glycerol kinase
VVGFVKAVLQFKDMLLSILAKAAGVIDAIIDDPIGFLGNLVAGVKLGLQNFVADILGAPIDRPTILETTALGAAYLAGLQSGLYPEPSTFAARWALDHRFTAAMDEATRSRKIAAWKHAVRRTLSGHEVAGTTS